MLASPGGPAGDERLHPVERRFGILLDSEFDQNGGGEMAFRLRQTVRLVLSKKTIAIDWPQLLYNLCNWKCPNKHVQKKWASSFYRAPENAPQLGANTKEEEIDNVD